MPLGRTAKFASRMNGLPLVLARAFTVATGPTSTKNVATKTAVAAVMVLQLRAQVLSLGGLEVLAGRFGIVSPMPEDQMRFALGAVQTPRMSAAMTTRDRFIVPFLKLLEPCGHPPTVGGQSHPTALSTS